MDRPVVANPSAPRGVTLRPENLVRLFLVVCIGLSIWLAVSPVRSYFAAEDRATKTSEQRRELTAEQSRLDAQTRELSRGSGLEEQARRQGLIDPSERAYVIQGVQTP